MPGRPPRQRPRGPKREAEPAPEDAAQGATAQFVTEDQQADIGTVFGRLVRQIQDQVATTGHQSAVDIELDFQLVQMTKSFPILAKRKDQSQMAIRLATRIVPKDDSN